MRWRNRERSRNVEDRRGRQPSRAMVGGGGIAVLIMALVAVLLGADPRAVLGLLEQQQQAAPQAGQPAVAGDETAEFISVVLRDTEQVWTRLFEQQVDEGSYQPPVLVIFSGTERSGCGMANAATGPFYCPADQRVYIDPSFFVQLKRRHQAPGDFAQAYVIAHEVAHHVQNQLGFMQQVDQVRRAGDSLASNQASVRLELQADYLAGVWAHHAEKQFGILEEGDIAEAMNAANQIGDDTLQRLSQGFVVPARYTHGTSAQRVRWFGAGLKSGDFTACRQLFERDYSDL